MPTNIDQNTKNVGLGIIQGTNTIIPFMVNSSGELLIEIIPVGALSSVVPTRMLIDANTKNTAGAVTNDASETIVPLTCDVIVDLPCLRVEM